jgi:hypothetical protein
VEIASTRTLNRLPRNSGLAAISRMAIPSAYSSLWHWGIADSSGNQRTVPAFCTHAAGLLASCDFGTVRSEAVEVLVDCRGYPGSPNASDNPLPSVLVRRRGHEVLMEAVPGMAQRHCPSHLCWKSG